MLCRRTLLDAAWRLRMQGTWRTGLRDGGKSGGIRYVCAWSLSAGDGDATWHSAEARETALRWPFQHVSDGRACVELGVAWLDVKQRRGLAAAC